MRLGIISSAASAAWGGSEQLWVALGKEALLGGHKVSVSVFDWGELPIKINNLKEQGASIHLRSRISYFDFKGKIKGKLTQLLFAEKQLHHFINKENPDLLFVSMGAFCDLEIDSLRNFLLKITTPFCLVAHSNNETYVVDFSKSYEILEVCKKAKKVFFVSNRIKEQSERQIAYDFNNADIAINPVNIEVHGVLQKPEMKIIQMACVGGLQVGVKGQAMLLQLLSTKKWRDRNWALNIFGQGQDEKLLKKLIDFYNLKDRVFMKGYTNDIRNEIWKYNHILLMPSFMEGMPISLIEAMLCGRTAVVTDVGGNREIIEDGIIGFIAEGATPFSFDNALERAWLKQDSWQRMGETAYEKVVGYYGQNPIGRLLKVLLEQL